MSGEKPERTARKNQARLGREGRDWVSMRSKMNMADLFT